jgi:carboxypeptidase C (cathepsin A)
MRQDQEEMPPASAKYSVEHMRLPAELQKNITFGLYEGGHMMYIHEPSMKKLRSDIEKFYESALTPNNKN